MWLNFSDLLKNTFQARVQKIPINAGFSCPNRDGTKGVGGCVFCNNDAFSPYYTNHIEISEQINQGMAFYGKRYKTNKFILYFQSYSNTYANDDKILQILDYSKIDPKIVGIILATRPDCITENFLDIYNNYREPSFLKSIEFGIETFDEDILKNINRGHSSIESINSIKLLEKYNNVKTGLHFILGLPGFSYQKFEKDIELLSLLKYDYVKIHHLQIIKSTILSESYSKRKDVILLNPQEYVSLLADFIERINPEVFIDRIINEVPEKYLIAPKWNNLRSNYIIKLLEEELKKRKSWQGKYFNKENPG